MTTGGNRGVTLLEMLIVVSIVAAIVSVSFPALTAGLAGVRLSSAAGDVASFITSTLNTVDRREQPEALVVSPRDNAIAAFTSTSGDKPDRVLKMPSGVTIDGEDPRRYVLFPGGACPRISVSLRSEKGGHRSIQIDPVTAVPEIRR